MLSLYLLTGVFSGRKIVAPVPVPIIPPRRGRIIYAGEAQRRRELEEERNLGIAREDDKIILAVIGQFLENLP